MTPDRYIVQFTQGSDVAVQAQAVAAEGGAVGQRFRHSIQGAVVTASPEEAARIEAMPGVAVVEPDMAVYATESWGLDRIDQRTLPLSGSFTAAGAGAGVDVYVVDTGVRSTHADLSGRVAPGHSVLGGGTEDCHGHGTHVAGIAAGETWGVAGDATIVPVRALDCTGKGAVSNVIAALDWIITQRAEGRPSVVNLSLGGDTTSDVLDAAVERVISAGVVTTVAAGNAGKDACQESPGRVPSALTVSASNSSDGAATFANSGPCVDLYAPGVEITSAWNTSDTATATHSGTSMAGPYVAGAAAVLLGMNPDATAGDVATAILDARTTGVLTGVPAGTPDGLLFLGPEPWSPTAVQPSPTEPAPETSDPVPEVTDPAPETTEPAPDAGAEEPAPTTEEPTTQEGEALVPTRAHDVRARTGSRSAVVRWERGTARGARITRQSVVVLSGGRRVATLSVRALATRARVLDLVPGKRYTFRVIEHSKVGTSRPSPRSNLVTARL
ncbi:MAG TPA: S8 family serine peptidase [Nocardioidaceae bacterium]